MLETRVLTRTKTRRNSTETISSSSSNSSCSINSFNIKRGDDRPEKRQKRYQTGVPIKIHRIAMTTALADGTTTTTVSSTTPASTNNANNGATLPLPKTEAELPVEKSSPVLASVTLTTAAPATSVTTSTTTTSTTTSVTLPVTDSESGQSPTTASVNIGANTCNNFLASIPASIEKRPSSQGKQSKVSAGQKADLSSNSNNSNNKEKGTSTEATAAVNSTTEVTTTKSTTQITKKPNSGNGSPNSYSLDFLHSVGVQMTGGLFKGTSNSRLESFSGTVALIVSSFD